MIFIAKNEDGILIWQLAKDGKKTVTRRLKPLPVGKEFAIQPGRGKFAVCRARVVYCENSFDHCHDFIWNSEKATQLTLKHWKEMEAHKEGFITWDGLMRFFQDKKIQFNDTYRIEFELI